MTGIAREVVGVDGLVSSRGVAESRHLVGGEGRVTNAFDFMVEFSTVGMRITQFSYKRQSLQAEEYES